LEDNVAKSNNQNIVEAAVKKAKNAQIGPDLYSNYQRMAITANEIVIDFYNLLPDPTNVKIPQATHLQRIIMTIDVANEFGQVLSNLIEKSRSEEDVEISPHDPSVDANFGKEANP
jgi:hypothetical protein